MKFLKTFLFLLFFFSVPFSLHAQEFSTRQAKAVIQEIVSVESIGESSNYKFKVKTEFGEYFNINTALSHPDGIWFPLEEGKKVLIRVEESGTTENNAYFEDVVRLDAIYLIIGLFVLVTLAVGWFRGLLSLLGLFFTIFDLFYYVFPQILGGADPVTTTIFGSIVILAVNIHLSHGFRLRTFFSFLGTLVGLLFVVLFTFVFVKMAHITGLATDDAALLFWDIENIKLPVGILMAGIILGAVGVLDDVAVTQAEIVEELQVTDPTLTRMQLFKKAMRIGRHHIASTVNTLILVYAGAAMPIFLLAMHYSLSTPAFLSNAIVAEEIVRTIAGTTALVLTVPIATAFATIPKLKVDNKHKDD